MLAKLWYNLADATYHQALTHLSTLILYINILNTTNHQALTHPSVLIFSAS